MSDSAPSSRRPVLKLKTAPRKSAPAIEAQPAPQAQSKLRQKPGATLSDDLKRRMQEDMDALIRR
jgi:hypothetical protein